MVWCGVGWGDVYISRMTKDHFTYVVNYSPLFFLSFNITPLYCVRALISPATLFSFFPFFISLYLKCFLFFLFHHFYPVASNLFSLYCQAKDSGSSNSFHSQPLKQSLVQPQSQSQTHTHNSVLTSSNSNAPQGFSSNAPHGFSSNAPQGFSSKDLQDPHTLGDRDRDRDRDRGRRGEETSELDEKVSTLKYQVRRVET